MTIEMRKIKKLIDMLEKSNLSEIELKEGEDAVRLVRKISMEPIIQHAMQPSLIHHPSSAILTQHTTHISEQLNKSSVESANKNFIRSPMVGTFYAAASPESQSFASVGQTIKAGDVLCIIEAMKMFNEIEADREGKIIEILIKNGEPVEYDQPLFVIE